MEIVRLDQERLPEASTVLARAFQDDPAWVWLIPDAEKRRRLLPWLFRVGFDVTAADVWTTAGVIRGAARWLPPGAPPRGVARAPRRRAPRAPRRCASGRCSRRSSRRRSASARRSRRFSHTGV